MLTCFDGRCVTDLRSCSVAVTPEEPVAQADDLSRPEPVMMTIEEVEAEITSDPGVIALTLEKDTIEMTYTANAKLFGFIDVPFEMDLTVTGSTVEVQSPWWLFLASDPVDEIAEEATVEMDRRDDMAERLSVLHDILQSY
jgi:hypothetical protein